MRHRLGNHRARERLTPIEAESHDCLIRQQRPEPLPNAKSNFTGAAGDHRPKHMNMPAIQLRAYDACVKGRRAVAYSARLFANPWWRRAEVAVCAVAEERCDRNARDNAGRSVQPQDKTLTRERTLQ